MGFCTYNLGTVNKEKPIAPEAYEDMDEAGETECPEDTPEQPIEEIYAAQ